MHEQLEDIEPILIIQSFIGDNEHLMTYGYCVGLILNKTRASEINLRVQLQARITASCSS